MPLLPDPQRAGFARHGVPAGGIPFRLPRPAYPHPDGEAAQGRFSEGTLLTDSQTLVLGLITSTAQLLLGKLKRLAEPYKYSNSKAERQPSTLLNVPCT